MWFLERFNAIPVSFSSTAFRAKSLQKPQWSKNNRQRTSGRVFLLKTRSHFLIKVGIVFSHTNPYNFTVTQRPPLRSYYNTHTTQNKGHTVYISPIELGLPVVRCCSFVFHLETVNLHLASTVIQYKVPSFKLGSLSKLCSYHVNRALFSCFLLLSLL